MKLSSVNLCRHAFFAAALLLGVQPSSRADDSLVARVFILAGQSNMEGQGVVDLDHPELYNGGKGILNQVMRQEGKSWRYSHLKDRDGKWSERSDVFVRFKTRHGLKRGGLSIGFTGYPGKHHIGPELQFGHVLGDAIDEPVLLIKTAWGGKSLHKDFRPPSAGGETGPYYQQMLDEVAEALCAAPEEFPKLAGHTLQISGFVWMQGWNDMFNEQARNDYQKNLGCLVRDLRRHFKNEDLPVVIGELGNGGEKASDNMKSIRAAQRAVPRITEFEGGVAFAPTAEFARAAKQSPNVGHGHHWFGNAESYFLIGDELGRSMLELLGNRHRVKRDIAYKKDATEEEDRRCKLDLYLPEGKAKVPLLVWFHGGGLRAGSKDRAEARVVGRYFSDRGIAVALVNYRLSPQAKFPAYVEDAAASVAWAIKNASKHNCDSQRVFVGGHSAGAYLTMLVGLDDSYLQRNQVKVADIAGWLPVSAQVDSHSTVRAERGVAKGQSVVDSSAPLYHVGGQTPPMLVIVVDNDLAGRAKMNRGFVDAMRKADHPDVSFHQISDRDHVSLITRLPDANDATAKRIIEFIEKR